MLVTLNRGLQVLLPFTDDVDRLGQAVERLRSSQAADASLEALRGDAARACEFPQGRPAALALGRGWVERARESLDSSLNGLAALARHLATLPGRKQIVLLSAGYSTDPGAVAAEVVSQVCGGAPEARLALRAGEVEAGRLLRLVIDEANRAQVSVYTVDLRGLMGDLPRASVGGASGGYSLQAVQALTRRIQREGQDVLSSIAEGTGAAAFVNTNDPARALRAAADDARSYYLLGYAPPPDREEGRFYGVDVRVARKGVSLRHRRGYLWLSEARRAEEAIGAAFLFPSLYSGEGLAVDAKVAGGRVAVTALIPTVALSFREEGGAFRNEITLRALLRDEKGRIVGDRYLFTKTASLKLPPARYAELREQENVEIPTEAALPRKGRFQLWIAAYHSDGRLAVASAGLEAR
jgi:VWFA-related protein